MSRDEPTTQELLIDHLRRIIEGVDWYAEPSGKKSWYFGSDNDRLVSVDAYDRSTQVDATMDMSLSLIGVEARDRIGNPRATEAIRKMQSIISEITGNNQSFREVVEEYLPPDADSETLQQAYAYEMLKKLDDMVERSRQTAQKMHLLESVPGPVDRYMQEATACFRYGFDSACISMCRAALEESLKHRISRDHGEKSISTVDQYGKTVSRSLSTLILEASKQYEYLNPDLTRYAENIQGWGNDCLHGTMGKLETKTWSRKSLFQTRVVLSVLYQTSRTRTEINSIT